MKNNLSEYFNDYNYIFTKINEHKINELIEYLRDFKNNIFLIGNGGSMALANHFAQDLLKKCNISAISLNSISNLSAYSNDISYDYSFSRQIDIYGKENDCLLPFSSSGRSDNIIYTCASAVRNKMRIVSFTGFDGQPLKAYSDINIHVPIDDYGIVESIHSILFHYVVDNLTLDNILIP